jgi:hypothetical protein
VNDDVRYNLPDGIPAHGQPAPEGPRSDVRTDDRSYTDELWRQEHVSPAASADALRSDRESPSSDVD